MEPFSSPACLLFPSLLFRVVPGSNRWVVHAHWMVLSCCRLDPQIHRHGQTVVPGCSGETAEGRKRCLPLYIWREMSKVLTLIEAKKARAHGISSENGDKKTVGKPSAEDPGGPAESLFLSR